MGTFRVSVKQSNRPNTESGYSCLELADMHLHLVLRVCNGNVTHYNFLIILIGVRLSPLGTAATTGLFYQPQMIDYGDCGEIRGMKIGRGSRSTRRKPAQCHLIHHKSHKTSLGLEHGPPPWEAST
jgi:hypothetical protein